MRSTCNGGLPRFIGTLQLLIYNKPPNMSIRAFEQQCVPWVDKNVVPGCKVCKAALKGRLSGMLRGSMQSTRHHCRLCGGITCDNCTERLLVDGPDGVVGIVQTFQVRAKLARLGKGAVEGDGGVKSADEQLAIIANDPESPTREPPILTCTQCYALIAEFHGMEKTWVSFVDKWLCDQVDARSSTHVHTQRLHPRQRAFPPFYIPSPCCVSGHRLAIRDSNICRCGLRYGVAMLAGISTADCSCAENAESQARTVQRYRG